jgi:AcrR family transcriptional regulator
MILPQLRLEGKDAIGMRGVAPTAGVDPVEMPDAPHGTDAPHGKLKPGPGRPAVEVGRHQRGRINRVMVDIVGEQGYGSVTVRELARRAEISTRTFYKHYSSKEECFLFVHHLVVRRLLRSIVAAQVGVSAPRERLRRSINAIIEEWSRDQKAARLMLVDAYVSGPVVLRQARRAGRSIGAQLGESLGGAADAAIVPPSIVEGIVAGLASTVRSHLLGQPGKPLGDLADGLTQWGLSYYGPAAAELEELGRTIGSLESEAVLFGCNSFKGSSSGA